MSVSEPPDGASIQGSSMDASAPSRLLFQNIYPMPNRPADAAGDLSFRLQCLDGPLPVGDGGLPNCVVVTARSLPWPGTSEQRVACNQCDEPGLAPFVAPAPLDAIGEGLSNYSCLCSVTALPPGSCPPAEDTGVASWCYSENAGPPHGGFCSSRPGPILAFSAGALEHGTLYVACFDPRATQ
jgi:hypothetical protein